MPRKKKSFEENLKKIDKIIENIESGEIELDGSIKEYEEAMKLITECNEILDTAEGKVKKLTEKNGEIREEDFE